MALELALLVLPLFLPGYLLVNVIFPGRGSLGGELEPLYRVFLGLVLSVALTIIYGSLLIVLAGADQVFLLPETLWPGLAILAVVFFLVGVWRGAYPRIARALGRPPAPAEGRPVEDYTLVDRLAEVSARLEALEGSTAVAPEEEEAHRERIDRLKREKRELEEQAARRA